MSDFPRNTHLVGDTIKISFPTQNGVSYQVAFKGSLMDVSWTPIEMVVGDGTTNSVFYAASDPARFYTVLTP